jgi:vitamin B12 transport system permease protein
MSSTPSFIQLEQQQKSRDVKRLTALTLLLAAVLIFSLCAGDSWLWPDQWLTPSAKLFVWQP